MASTSDDPISFGHRCLDVVGEPRTMLLPIEGYENMPLVSLEKAVEPLESLVTDIQRYVWIVKQRCKHPPDALSSDESAAIMLYTAEWELSNNSLYYILNSTLRTENRKKLKPWFSYLKLLLTALSYLSPIDHELNLYRGVTMNMKSMYPKDETFVWWGFSSCTTTVDVLDRDEFLGKTGTRTMFIIKCYSARDISQHSCIKNEKEALLLPATQFIVTGTFSPSSDFHIIELQETEPLYNLLGSRPNHHRSSNQRVRKSSSTFKRIPIINHMFSSSNRNEYNSKLEKIIAKCESRSSINLDRQNLTDHDIQVIIHQAINEKQCKMLHLSYNNITFEGFSNLVEALDNNKTLEGLYMFNNKIGDNGVNVLAQILSKNNCNIKAIGLGWNKITDEGVHYIADMLKTNKILIDLCLPQNQITDQGFQILANVLIHHNTTIIRLSLDLNEFITDSSVNSLIGIIKQNQSLNEISMLGCKLSKQAKTKILEISKSKNNFKVNL